MDKPQRPRPPVPPKPKLQTTPTQLLDDTKTTAADHVICNTGESAANESLDKGNLSSTPEHICSSLQSLQTADGNPLPTSSSTTKNTSNVLSSAYKSSALTAVRLNPNDCVTNIHMGTESVDSNTSSSLLVSVSEQGGDHLQPPPRTKKMLKIKQRQSLDDPNMVGATLRDKEQSASANRSSKPPRGTLMLAMNDLLSKVGESSSPARLGNRPAPRPRSKSGSLHPDADDVPASSLLLSKSFKNVLFNPSPCKDPRAKPLNSGPIPRPRHSLVMVNSSSNNSGLSKPHTEITSHDYPITEETGGNQTTVSIPGACQAEKSEAPTCEVDTNQVEVPNPPKPDTADTSNTAPSSNNTAKAALSVSQTDEMVNHYGHIWTNKTPSNIETVSPEMVIQSQFERSNPLGRTISMPIRASPKLKPRRPSGPPPAPPAVSVNDNSLGVKRLVPSRPPPPVPKDINIPKSFTTLSTSNSNNTENAISGHETKDLAEQLDFNEADLNVYTDIDEDGMLLEPDNTPQPVKIIQEQPTSDVSHSCQAAVMKKREIVILCEGCDIWEGWVPYIRGKNEGVSCATRETRQCGEGSDDLLCEDNIPGEDVYMTPASQMEDWPDEDAPLPPGTPNHALNEAKFKSATLQSFSSNVYEDLDSTSDDEPSGITPAAAAESVDDVYSDNLDETFNSQDDLKVGSSSESEPEAEESDEVKLAKQRDKVFRVAQEIVTTEEDFFDKLVLLNIDFRKHVSAAAENYGEEVIPSKCMNSILNYLPQLAYVNEDLLKDLKQRIENWDADPRIADVFVRKGAFLQMYATYIRDFQNMTSELDNAIRDYPLFAETLKTFEKSERCRNLQLRHYMLKPIQRIPQYRLLLNEYRKYLPADSPDTEDAQKALEIVCKVADHANDAMKQNDSFQSLLELQSLLLGDFKVIEPSRVLVRRGDVFKQSRKELQPRTLFLFNDYLVLTRPQPGGHYRIKHILPLLNMLVNKPVQEDFHKEFTIITKKRSFTSVTFMPKERDEWVTILEHTIEERERKIETYNTGLIEQTRKKEHVLGAVAPVWIADDRVSMCMTCSSSFTLLNRRHHCRACGQVVCGLCSAYRAPLKYEEYHPKRVCGGCYEKLLEEAESDANSGNQSKNGFVKERHKQTPKSKQRTVLQEVQANDIGDLSGYLHVHHKKKVWEKHWFVLKEKVLYKYNACEDTAAIGYKVAQVGKSDEGSDKDIMFRLFHPSMDIIEPILFKTETVAAAERWIAKMQESTTA